MAEVKTYREALREALVGELDRDENVVIMGEDIGVYGGQVKVPLVIRGPNGGGVQLSAQHTLSLESFYGHFPGLKVVAPVTPNDAKGMMLTAVRDDNCVIFLEAGALYG